MKYILKSIIALFIILNFFMVKSSDTVDLVLFFLLITVTLLFDIKDRRVLPYILMLESVLIVIIGIKTDYVLYALMFMLFDIISINMYFFGIIFAGIFIYFRCYYASYDALLGMAVIGCAGYIISSNNASREKYIKALDAERQVKYELEIAQANLLKSSNELQRLTQVKERNRIARDLHDNIGHKIAGVLISLQAAYKLIATDKTKGQEVLEECINHLQSSLQTIRDTVHDMYSDDLSGINYLKSIADNYKYCSVEFVSDGKFDRCPQKIIVTFSYLLKEMLTNTARHSMADAVYVDLCCIDQIVTMKYKDNGVGCSEIIEGLGIKSMRDRIRAIGGTIKIDSSDGMNIVCIVPYE